MEFWWILLPVCLTSSCILLIIVSRWDCECAKPVSGYDKRLDEDEQTEVQSRQDWDAVGKVIPLNEWAYDQSVSDWVALPLKEQVHSLWCSLIHLSQQRLRWHWWLGMLSISFSWWPSHAFVWTQIAWFNDLCSGNLQIGLLRFTLAALEDGSEATAGAECGSLINNWDAEVQTYKTNSGLAVLAVCMLPAPIHSADFSLHSPTQVETTIPSKLLSQPQST